MSEEKKIMVGIPMHKSEVHSQVIHSAIMGGSDIHEVDVFPMGLSLLAKCFNMLWIKAYMEDYDYFVIHHSDLGVVGTTSGYEGTWMDLLVERMQELKAAAMCPVINIKSDKGTTSTAIECVPGDPHSLRLLTMQETGRLPEDYICREDVCEVMGLDPEKTGALLINTGCLIMNLKDFPWAEFRWPGFNIEDKIAWNLSGRPESYTIPEDWNMSRWFHYEGGKDFPYYATRETVVAHMGQIAWLNNEYETGEPVNHQSHQMRIEDYEQSE